MHFRAMIINVCTTTFFLLSKACFGVQHMSILNTNTCDYIENTIDE